MRRLLLAVVLVSPLLAQQPAPPKPIAHPAFPTGDATPLGSKISALLADPSVSRAHWGIAVTALDGTPIYGFDEGKLFRPASNAKIFTSITATQMLGLDRTFTTTVEGLGTIRDGVLKGDLVLKGGGDANFASGYVLPYLPKQQRPKDAKPVGLADFDDLAVQIAAKGIREIDGDVVGSDIRFEGNPYPEGWAIDDMLWGYGAPVSALTVHDNQLDLTIMPAPASSLAKDAITLDPAVPFYTVNATPLAGHMSSVDNAEFDANRVMEQRDQNSRDFHIEGYVATKYGPYTGELAIDQPAAFAAAALKQALQQHGIIVKGNTRAQHYDSGDVGSFMKEAHADPSFLNSYRQRGNRSMVFTPAFHSECNAQRAMGLNDPPDPEEHRLAQKVSVPFAEDLVLTLKESQNLHAEIMLRNLGVETDCMGLGHLSAALAVERAFLTVEAGLNGEDFEFYDGSGLSAKDLVAPRATAQLLSFATTQPWFAQWKSALPVGGVDGTLASRFPNAPLKGHLFAKTGTLGESRALSGYVDCASGRQVIFSIMVDDHSPVTSADRVVMDKIVTAIAAEN